MYFYMHLKWSEFRVSRFECNFIQYDELKIFRASYVEFLIYLTAPVEHKRLNSTKSEGEVRSNDQVLDKGRAKTSRWKISGLLKRR